VIAARRLKFFRIGISRNANIAEAHASLLAAHDLHPISEDAVLGQVDGLSHDPAKYGATLNYKDGVGIVILLIGYGTQVSAHCIQDAVTDIDL
jgi:hypothetical protein